MKLKRWFCERNYGYVIGIEINGFYYEKLYGNKDGVKYITKDGCFKTLEELKHSLLK